MKGLDKVKLYKSTKEPEIYHYFNANKEKLWMFRHKYYDATGKRKEKKKSGFKTEKAALKALLEVKASTLRGEKKFVENDQLTVSEWLDTWYEMNHKKWKIGTRVQREIIVRVHLKPLLGHYKLQKLDKQTYQRIFINVLVGDYKPSTIRAWHTIFKIAINSAVEEEILIRNRFTKVTIPTEAKKKKEAANFLTPTELVTFLDDAKQNENVTHYTFFLTIAYTGIRRGEALGLQWKNIDFQKNTITIERTRDVIGVHTPKTMNSYRTILVDEMVMKQLETYLKWCKKALFKNGRKLQDDLSKDDTFVFIFEHAADPIAPTSPIYAFNKILDRTGLPKTTIHGLRHTHCTILLNRGLNVKVIAERLGNTPKMIMDVYGHVLKELEAESVSLFSQTLQASGAKIGANH
ncbi:MULTISPECIES: site-specific integrase [Lysinibacillus]|uniref:site-specific integrase n=1 Tax=Lysinibacillus TaxID=400634 RepID=UPI0021A2B6DB|nr:site-specific integrase [Lysinibacillus capsici]MCT1539496.1 site-specific integrase [Lysinibacillus capsici]MCT1570437.1 site-specific integrase [Lysinibacillus capsici]MCT1647655.1 site-specific integrase [Lysinibacillus capsici]MCT1726066.1 site-specific integrase [Lysinibacillus capsici]MCT1783171.1 site-specific integrase [Lysinibacillus capsici]